MRFCNMCCGYMWIEENHNSSSWLAFWFFKNRLTICNCKSWLGELTFEVDHYLSLLAPFWLQVQWRDVAPLLLCSNYAISWAAICAYSDIKIISLCHKTRQLSHIPFIMISFFQMGRSFRVRCTLERIMQSSVPQDFFVQWQVEGLLYSLLTNDLFCVLGNVYCFVNDFPSLCQWSTMVEAHTSAIRFYRSEKIPLLCSCTIFVINI